MRIVVLTQNFPPEVGATAARLHGMTKKLAEQGHRVTVITAMPNYPTGRIFDGYRGKVRAEDELDGVRVVRTWTYPSNSSNSLPRFLSYTSFTLSSLLMGIWGLGRQDIVLFDTPPLPLVPTGLAIGRITGARVVMNVSDIWPEMAMQLGYPMGRVSLWALKQLESLGYRRSDVVTVTNGSAKERISQRFPDVRTAVISNGADLHVFDPSLRSQEVRESLGTGPEDFLVGYFGLHGLFQGLDVVVEAAERLRDRRTFRFVMVGDGPCKEALIELAERRELDNLHFLDLVDRNRVPSLLASCDASLVPLASEFPSTMPSKVYETLASGVPVVITSGCEGARLVEEGSAGRTFRPGNSKELVEALIGLEGDREGLAQIRENCRNLAERFDYDRIAVKTEAILQAVADGAAMPKFEE